jgi:predicted amidophosphoribosyltransferase
MKLSNCCGAAPRSNGDCDTEDFGLCPDCKDHCEYIEFCDDCGEEIKDCVCELITKPVK